MLRDAVLAKRLRRGCFDITTILPMTLNLGVPMRKLTGCFFDPSVTTLLRLPAWLAGIHLAAKVKENKNMLCCLMGANAGLMLSRIS